MRVSIRTVGKAPEMLHGQLQFNSQKILAQTAISNDLSLPISDGELKVAMRPEAKVRRTLGLPLFAIK